MRDVEVVSRFALYGELGLQIEPEFVHLEPISARSSLYEWRIAPHAHPGIFQLLFLDSGNGSLSVDGQVVPLHPGTLVALPSGSVHAFQFEPGAEGLVLSVATDLLHDPRMTGLHAGSLEGARQARWSALAEEAHLRQKFVSALGEFESAIGEHGPGGLRDLQIAQLAVILLLAQEILSGKESEAGKLSRRDELVHRFRNQVEAHFRDQWSVEQHAAELAVTAATLTRACREALGKSPGQLVLDRTLLEAMRHLTFTGSTIGQIAEGLGFSDLAYFSRFFSKRVGMSASEFRRCRTLLGHK